MPILTAERAAEASSGRLVGNGAAAASTLVADSRAVRPGAAFAAVRTGHRYIGEAVRAGASFVVVEREDMVPAGAPAVIVDDTVRALGCVAADFRRSLDVRVVGITGSTGKTLTKDFVAAALAARYRVHAAPSSYNNEVGVPLVVLGCPDDADVIVAELAARHPGEIADLCSMCRPDLGVLTGVGMTHVGVFGSREAIASTKAELLESLPADGLAIVPSDDDFLARFSGATAARLATVGPGGQVQYWADGVNASGRTHGRVMIGGAEVDVTLRVPGQALIRNAAMAIRVAAEWGIDPVRASRAISGVLPTAWRMEITRIGRWMIVNDAWNANPTSMASALRTVRELRPQAPSWAVLGEMAELGPLSSAAHRRIGRLARRLGFSGVVAVGEGAEPIALGAGDVAYRVGSLIEAAELVCGQVPPGSVVLVKGSRVTGLERFPDALRAALARARQEV